MKIVQNISDNNLFLNGEVNFRPDLGWEDGMQEFEKETLKSIINPSVNFETVRYIHSGYTHNDIFQSDIWYYFYFFNGLYPPIHELDYLYIGLTTDENVKLLRHTNSGFFRLEFYQIPEGELPNSSNRKLVFTKHLPIPLGEKINYSPTDSDIFVPIFTGSNYRNKENMYLFWLQDYSVLAGTPFSGDTFYMTTKFFNTIDGEILPFEHINKPYNASITEETDVYHKVVVNRDDYSYVVYSGNTNIRIGTSDSPIKFYCSRVSSSTLSPPPIPSPSSSPFISSTPSITPTVTPSKTATVTPTPTVTTTTTPTISVTPTITTTPTPTPSRTVPIQHCVTPTPSISTTPSISVSVTPSTTPSVTPSISISVTPSLSPGASPSVTPTITPSVTPTISLTPSGSPEATPSNSPTATPSVSISLTPSITPSITPSTSVIAFSTCAPYGIQFDSYSENLIGLLTVGNVVLTSGTIGDYRIDWSLNAPSGSTVFITGNAGNTDPNIQAYQPVNSELVQAGELYPVLRYIRINGVYYTPYVGMSGYSYSPDLLTCLPSITVDSMSCSNGATGSTWFHTISYSNATMPSSTANRSLTYMLNSDGSSFEIAWQFYGYTIADRITISYVTGSTLEKQVIEDWVIGGDSPGFIFDTTPRLNSSQSLRSIFCLSGFTYQNGDYLLFDVKPAYNSPGNTDTNWQLQISCFDTSRKLDLAFIPSNDYCLIDTGAATTMVWNQAQCQYEANIHTLSGLTNIGNTDVYKYLEAGVSFSSDWGTDTKVILGKYTNTSQNWAINPGPYFVLDGQLTISVTGSTHVTTYSFTHQTDYLYYKSGYAIITGTSAWAEWVINGAHFEHYQQIQNDNKISLTTGDTFTYITSYFDHSASLVFDDINRIITIFAVPQVNQYSGSTTCNYATSTIQSYVYNINNWYSGVTGTWTTVWGMSNPFDFLRITNVYEQFTTSQEWAPSLQILTGMTSNTITLGPRWHLLTYPTYPQYSSYNIYKYYVRVVITNTDDPLNNWELYSALNTDGSVNYSTYPSLNFTLIKKVGI